MITCNNDFYNDNAIKESEKRTERDKSKKSLAHTRHIINSQLFKNFFDFPPDENELDDGIEQF